MSQGAYTTNSRFGNANEFVSKIEEITKNTIINNMEEAEEIEADIMIIAPCSRK